MLRSASSTSAHVEALSFSSIRTAAIHIKADSVQENTMGNISALLSKTNEFPQVIPDDSSRKGRNLVVCFDGTGEEFDEDVSYSPCK